MAATQQDPRVDRFLARLEPVLEEMLVAFRELRQEPAKLKAVQAAHERKEA